MSIWIRVLLAGAALAVLAPGLGARSPARPTQTVAGQPARDASGDRAGAQGVITGVVVGADSGRPERHVDVRVSGGDPRVGRTVVTDETGAFAFERLPPGRYTLLASKPGYLDSEYGQKVPGNGRPGTPVHVAGNQRVGPLTLRLARGGVLTGIVRDEAGEPVFGTQVRAMRLVMRTGERRLEQAGSADTDDRGIYRIPMLPPGEYVVVAYPRDAAEELAVADLKRRAEAEVVAAKASGDPAMMDRVKQLLAARDFGTDPAAEGESPRAGYAPVYYPGTTLASAASVVPLSVSEEHGGVDMQLQLVTTAPVSGTLTMPDGSSPRGALVMLVGLDQILRSAPVRTTTPGPDGRFSFSGVSPGNYTVLSRANIPGPGAATASPPQASSEEGLVAAKMRAVASMSVVWTSADVAVSGQPASNVALVVRPGVSVSGSVSFEGSSSAPDSMRLRVTLVPVGGPPAPFASTAQAAVDANGRFTIRNVLPGRYRFESSGAVGPWTLSSAVLGGRETLDTPVEISGSNDLAGAVLTFTDRQTSLTGSVQDAAGAPADNFTIIVFPSDSQYWTPLSRRIQSTRPSTDGRFGFTGLPAGAYRLIAVDDVEDGQWFDPAFLRQLAGQSVALTLAPGQDLVQDLRVSR